MISGQQIKARTHAELLSKLLKKNINHWYKCTYNLDKDTFIWMVYLDNSETNGHKNMFEDESTIIECFDKNKRTKDGRFYHGLKMTNRLVFEKIETSNGRIYQFHGLYKLVDTTDDEYTRILKRQNNRYEFPCDYDYDGN